MRRTFFDRCVSSEDKFKTAAKSLLLIMPGYVVLLDHYTNKTVNACGF